MPLGKSGKHYSNPHHMSFMGDDPGDSNASASQGDGQEMTPPDHPKAIHATFHDDGTAHTDIHHADDSHEHTDHASHDEAHDHMESMRAGGGEKDNDNDFNTEPDQDGDDAGPGMKPKALPHERHGMY